MNREIKFRVWKNNTMLQVGDGVLKEIYFDENNWNEDKDGVLMQYIGLKDKNGKEIYEGDIIKHITISDEGIFSETVGGLVIFESGSFMCYYKEAKIKVKLEAWLLETTMTMVGNIFENPNLLDNTSKI